MIDYEESQGKKKKKGAAYLAYRLSCLEIDGYTTIVKSLPPTPNKSAKNDRYKWPEAVDITNEPRQC
jgi:hypothetical protein